MENENATFQDDDDDDDDDDIIMLLWWWCHCTKEEKSVFSRNRKVFFNALPEDLKARLYMRTRRHFVALPPLSLRGTNSS
eukprot:8744757-Ditylum_brightwellii.AAC.1